MKYCFYMLLCSTAFSFAATPPKPNSSQAAAHKSEAEYRLIATHPFGDGMEEGILLVTITSKDGVHTVVDHTKEKMKSNPNHRPTLQLFGLTAIGQPRLSHILKPKSSILAPVAEEDSAAKRSADLAARDAAHEASCLQPTEAERAQVILRLAANKTFHANNHPHAPAS